MKVLVAGATSVIGIPVIGELRARGHDVVGLTRRGSKSAAIAEAGAHPVVADVFDNDAIAETLARVAPDAVISLLTTLPKYGPLRLRDFDAAQKLWGRGVTNLLDAASRAGCVRFVAESVIFAYGYGDLGATPLDETRATDGPPPGWRGRHMIETLRGMEQSVLHASATGGTEGIVLRYGAFHGLGVTHSELMVRLARLSMMPVPTGGGVLSWVEISDAARATVDALERGSDGEVYNIVDDQAVSFRQYVDGLAACVGRPRSPSIPRLLVRLVAPYVATAFGQTRLRVSNAKAKRELGWAPDHPTYVSAQATFASPRKPGQ